MSAPEPGVPEPATPEPATPATPATPAEFAVKVDRTRCVGTGLCAATAPADLALDEDGRARPRRTLTDALAEVIEAAELCPVEAIAVHRARTGERIAPAW